MVTHTFSFWSRPPPVFPRPSNPASRFRWALLEFRVEFCYFEFELLFFVSIFGSVSRSTSPTFSSIFFFIFSSFQFFYQSVAHGPFRRRDHPLPTRWKLTSFCFGWDDQQCSHHREKGLTNTRSRSFLSGSSFKYMCVCVKRGGTAVAERSRFFKYDIKKQKRKKNSYLLVHKWRKRENCWFLEEKNKTTISCNKTTTTVRSWTKSKRLKK